jgi:nucleoside-diphosphate-sugar epimerase
MRTLIIGKNSFIGKSFYHATKNVDIISYSDIDRIDFSKYNTVLNCAITPEFKTEDYKQRNDLDYQVAILAAANKCHYIMMSTRKVYGTCDDLQILNENSGLNPTDYYGDNKATSEKKIMELGSSYTILRASNVYGFEYGRNSFMGFCMDQLKHTDKIVYSISDKAKRDFISIKSVCKVLNKVVELKPQGIYNLSSNHGTEIGDVARALIEGYDSGEFIVTGNEVKDQFILVNTKLLKTLDIELPIFQRKYIKKLGEKL